VVEAISRHPWAGGGTDAVAPARLAALMATPAPVRDPDGA
jgi:hypothetical protein